MAIRRQNGRAIGPCWEKLKPHGPKEYREASQDPFLASLCLRTDFLWLAPSGVTLWLCTILQRLSLVKRKLMIDKCQKKMRDRGVGFRGGREIAVRASPTCIPTEPWLICKRVLFGCPLRGLVPGCGFHGRWSRLKALHSRITGVGLTPDSGVQKAHCHVFACHGKGKMAMQKYFLKIS